MGKLVEQELYQWRYMNGDDPLKDLERRIWEDDSDGMIF